MGCKEGAAAAGAYNDVDHLDDANTLLWVKLKGLRPVIVHGIPELWTTRERRNAGHKGRDSTIRAKKGRPRWATGCGNGQGGLSREEYLLFGAAERS